MKALVKETASRGARLIETYPDPEVEGSEVLIRVERAAVCGTDIHLYDWDSSATAFHPKLPLIMGHECSGTVAAVGPEVRRVRVGERVSLETHIPCGDCFQCRTGSAHNCLNMGLVGLTVQGAFADVIKVPEVVCFRLPDAVTFEEAALFEPAGVAVHALQRANITPGDAVLICGCGFIGLVAIQLCLLAGAATVVALDVNEYRLAKARGLGAVALNPQREDVRAAVNDLTGRRGGVDVAFEMSGAASVYPGIFGYIRREGTLVSVGHPGKPVAIDVAAHINKQGVVFKGVFGRRIWDTWEILASLIGSKRVDLASLVTHHLRLNEYETAFAAIRDKGIKAMFHVRGQ